MQTSHLGKLLLFLQVSSCQVTRTAIDPTVTEFDQPEIGQECEAELGDTILRKGRLYVYDALELRSEVAGGDGFILKKITVPPQTLVAREESKTRTYYFGSNVQCYDALLGTRIVAGGVAVHKENADDFAVFIDGGLIALSRPPLVSNTKVAAEGAPSFQQELIYNGRTGSHVKFLYREFAGDMIRGQFSQEVQYDLSEGDTIGFKGARVHIVEASNMSLRYRVLQSFPGVSQNDSYLKSAQNIGRM